MTEITFIIYIAGTKSRHFQLVELYKEICSNHLSQYTVRIEVVDLLQHPSLAEKNKILATPTISRISPGPEKRIIGSMTPEQAIQAISFLTDDL